MGQYAKGDRVMQAQYGAGTVTEANEGHTTIDFDEHGQCFIEACVIPHLFHMVQGGRFTRQAGSHFNPHVYDDITTIADHVHWVGNKGPHAANARSARSIPLFGVIKPNEAMRSGPPAPACFPPAAAASVM